MDPTLHWIALEQPTIFDVQISQDPLFLDAETIQIVNATDLRIDNLEPEVEYFWRVRAVDAGQKGPWSDIWQFTTQNLITGKGVTNIQGFMTVSNAAGPIDPPDMAALAFDDLGFPLLEGTLTPTGSYPDPELPTRGVQQSTNNSIWAVHTGGESRQFFDNYFGQSFLERSTRQGGFVIGEDDYEWRFTQDCLDKMDGTIENGDCLAFRAFGDLLTMEVPFELWNIGTLPDTTDDYRMVPIICEFCNFENDESIFDIGSDHASSPDLDDPYTDWVYWHNPPGNNKTPGEQAYFDFFAGEPELDITNEVFARTVLVQLDGGTAPPYDVALPEPGTTFRIVTGSIQPPLLSAPVNQDIQTTEQTALYWNALPALYHLQIDRSPDFTSPIINFDFLEEPFFTTDLLPKNDTYYWRVRMLSFEGVPYGDWSETWQFTIPINVTTDSPDGLPLAFTLEPNYPNPFNTTTTIRYALPRAEEVRLEVYDLLGRQVAILQNQTQPAGWHEASFNASRLSSGVYIYRLSAGDFTETKTMMVVR